MQAAGKRSQSRRYGVRGLDTRVCEGQEVTEVKIAMATTATWRRIEESCRRCNMREGLENSSGGSEVGERRTLLPNENVRALEMP